MNCQEIEIQLMEYVAGELDAITTENVAHHLNLCSSCCKEWEREKVLSSTLGSLPAAESRADFLAGNNFSYPDPPGKWWLPISGGAIAATILLTFLISSQSTEKLAAPVSGPGPRELATATEEVKWTLTLASNIIQASEKATIKDLLGSKLPSALSGSLFPDKNPLDNNRS
jgi:hypothetical protein